LQSIVTAPVISLAALHRIKQPKIGYCLTAVLSSTKINYGPALHL